jgi:endonuclease III-like uncharacterized protein
MVVTEIALAVVLLIGAGLMMKSLLRLLQTNIGFNTEKVLTMTVILPPAKYTDNNQQINFNDQLRERVQSLPGVSGAGTVDILPVNAGNTTRFYVDGYAVRKRRLFQDLGRAIARWSRVRQERHPERQRSGHHREDNR